MTVHLVVCNNLYQTQLKNMSKRKYLRVAYISTAHKRLDFISV